MRLGSLFSGYGGLDMAVEAVTGASTAWLCEFDKGPSAILAHDWPGVPNLGDITTVDWAGVEPVDVLTGGFPCQDVSHAGRRAGLIRHGDGRTRSGLWGQMLRAIDELRPGLVVAENVRGLLSAKADSDVERCPWCMGEAGHGEPAMRALGAVLADLADVGYDAAWCGLRAADLGAPHGRFRVFILAWPADAKGVPGRLADGDDVRARSGAHGRAPHAGRGAAAYTTGTRRSEGQDLGTGCRDAGARARGGEPQRVGREPLRLLPTPPASDANGSGNHGGGGPDLRTVCALLPMPAVNDMGARKSVDAWDAWTERMQAVHGNGNGHGKSLSVEARRMLPGRRFGDYAPAVACWEHVLGRDAPPPTEPTDKGGESRLSPAFVEWLMGLPAGWVTDVPGLSRNAQLKALGNGVVPQQAAAALDHLLDLAGVAA